jgi:sugar phosphate permease
MSANSNLESVPRERPAIYYGWWILGAGAITEMLALGSTSYSAGLFVIPLEAEFGFSRAAASSALSIAFAGAALMAPLVGYLLDRFSVRTVIAAGGLGLGLGFAFISLSSNIPLMVAALLIPVAFGGMAVGPLTTSTLTSRWFYRRRGRALGLASVATSGGGILVVPLLALAIQYFGWRNALFMEAIVISVIVLVLANLVIRGGPADLDLENHPENIGRPSSDFPAPAESASATAKQWRYGEIAVTRDFWAVAFVIAAISGINQAIVVTIVPYGAQLGFSAPASAFLVSAFAVCAAIVKVSSGLLSEFIDRRAIMLAGALAIMAALILLLLSSAYAPLFAAVCFAGAGLGCVLPSSAAQLAGTFGAPSFGKVMGMIYVGVVVSSVASVYFAGAMFDRSGNYNAAFAAFLGLAILMALATRLMRAAK